MHKCSTYCITFFLLLNSYMGVTQQDTVFHELHPVEIKAVALREQSLGSPIQTWETQDKSLLGTRSLAELLGSKAGTYIKSYGLGSLATSSVRGGAAGHTLVLWNGLPIQSPMLGQLDLSLLPIQAVEQISFQKGGNSALWGSGAIGGVISLENQSGIEQGLAVQTLSELGSFGLFRQYAQVGIGNGQIYTKSKFVLEQADNDFSYPIAPGMPERQQTNASLTQQNFFQDVYGKLSEQDQLSLHLWYQDSDREIPPTSVQSRSEAFQADRALRMVLKWTHQHGSSKTNAKGAFFQEELVYADPQIGLEALSHFHTYMGEITHRWAPNASHHFLAGLTHTLTEAESAGYAHLQQEHRTAFFSSWQWVQARYQIQTSLRQALIEGKWAPLVPELGARVQLSPRLQAQVKISRNYRLPTLNDRFWSPGGNPELLPESGWSQEMTWKVAAKVQALSLTGTLTGFNRKIDNWILWAIPEGQSFWSAHNITQVWSRGVEPRLKLGYTDPSWKVLWENGYDYIRSTNQRALEQPHMPRGMQLLYTPMHQGFTRLEVDYGNFSLSYQHQFTGAAQGINEPIEAFQTGAFKLQYAWNLRPVAGRAFFNLYNAWDHPYFILERRPMPGRHIRIGLQLQLP